MNTNVSEHLRQIYSIYYICTTFRLPPAHPLPHVPTFAHLLPTPAHRSPRLPALFLNMPTPALCPPSTPSYPCPPLPIHAHLCPPLPIPCPPHALVHGYTYGQDL
jgi:hypothetical protein